MDLLHLTTLTVLIGSCWTDASFKNKIGNVSVDYYKGEFVMKFDGNVVESLKVKRSPRETVGEPWPLPQRYSTDKNKLFRLDPRSFIIFSRNISCDILEKAILRYRKIIFESASGDFYDNLQHTRSSPPFRTDNGDTSTTIPYLSVAIRHPCPDQIRDTSDESYSITIETNGAYLVASEVWGALRGLETFSQIVFMKNNEYYIKKTEIQDFPRFRHRGILMDTARHYINKDVILEILGAYHPSKIYTHEDIEEIIEFAKYRGIRVMPEFDVPGHSYSWGLGYPKLLTQCYKNGQPVPAFYGPMDPSKNETYAFLKKHFNEVFQVFKDRYVHLGGDEVPMDCWQSNPEVQQFVAKLLSNKSVSKLSKLSKYKMKNALKYFTDRLTNDLILMGRNRSEGIRFVMWEEVWRNKVPIPIDTIIQVWMGSIRELESVINSGHQAIYSSCWYIDHIPYGVHWPKYYGCDPGTAAKQGNEKMILGGEACLWSEFVTSETYISLLWPRASAVAERRGLKVGYINGPDYCLSDRKGEDNQKRSLMGFNSNGYIEMSNLSVLFRKNPFSFSCTNDLAIFSIMFTLSGTVIVVFVFGRKIKSIYRLLPKGGHSF
ncbi:hypothetical protein KUTeg_019279 [Tegillarca granosa]|uniref:beta-N-acetylhexosaminidase n=1 Tax=Tegillarca granosa TaxID=220873 RepID=A0ABQ9EC26_TEGGR|nr:hypothetical protein KUTeg_019279 [Tegillarca granosa]